VEEGRAPTRLSRCVRGCIDDSRWLNRRHQALGHARWEGGL